MGYMTEAPTLHPAIVPVEHFVGSRLVAVKWAGALKDDEGVSKSYCTHKRGHADKTAAWKCAQALAAR